jgi:alpha-tubulin suppressor-like RCC1 family protein
LGHHDVQNQYNLSTPKAVEFLNDPDVKIIFVSASQKHTLCVDTEGELWYFGEKQSVGIHDKRNKYQFSPIRLVASNHDKYSRDEKRFRFVAAGVNNNMVITMMNGEIYNFGQDVSRPQNFNELNIEEDDVE